MTFSKIWSSTGFSYTVSYHAFIFNRHSLIQLERLVALYLCNDCDYQKLFKRHHKLTFKNAFSSLFALCWWLVWVSLFTLVRWLINQNVRISSTKFLVRTPPYLLQFGLPGSISDFRTQMPSEWIYLIVLKIYFTFLWRKDDYQ